MMGTDEQQLRDKVDKMEEDHRIQKKKIDTKEFQSKRNVDKEQRYI